MLHAVAAAFLRLVAKPVRFGQQGIKTGCIVVLDSDDAEADVSGALIAGAGAAYLVCTGKFRPGHEARFEPLLTLPLCDGPLSGVVWLQDGWSYGTWSLDA